MQPEAGAWQGRAEGPVTPSGNAYRMCIIIDITYTQAEGRRWEIQIDV